MTEPTTESLQVKRNMRNSVMPAILAILTITAVEPLSAQLAQVVRPHVTRPDGPVWQVIRKNCTTCHGIDDYAYYALDKAGWQKLIETKHKEEGVTLKDADENTLLDWL